MKYLFVIYTDIEYKEHLDNFKTQEFYRQICDDPNIEVMEWGSDFHTDYNDLPIKTQQMMKWCSENKEYDYLIKCDDTIFDDKWIHYSDRLVHEKLFLMNSFEHQWKWGEVHWKSYEHGFHDIYSNGFWGKWESTDKLSDDYRGINLLKLDENDWLEFEKNHDSVYCIDINFIPNDIPFFEGKFYMVSKKFSIFIGGQESLAKELSTNFPVEDLMIGYLKEDFK